MDNRQSNTEEEEEEEGHIHVRDETNIFREMYTEKKKMQTHTHTSDFIEKILRKKNSEEKERKISFSFIFKRNPFDLLVMYS